MKFSGELFTYDQDLNLVAFESGPKGSKQVVVFIGGLGDGLNALPCLEPLAETLDSMGWSLVQVQLGSSFNGYGTTNLQTDTKQLDTLVDFLKTQREKTRIVFLGHSTGSQDCYWHNKHGRNNKVVNGYILQAPCSDREYLQANLEGFQESYDFAVKFRSEGKGQELLPRDTFWAPITADRFYSLAAKGGDDDVFSTDLSEAEIKELYIGVERPLCWVYSEKDEFYASNQSQLEVMKRFQSICPAIKECHIVPEGDHNITKPISQKAFCNIVKGFIENLAE